MSSWRNNPPREEDFDTREEYEEALAEYDAAIDEDIEAYFLRRAEE